MGRVRSFSTTVTLSLALASFGVVVRADDATHAPPPPLLMLYPDTVGNSDDMRALASVRVPLRNNDYFDVMTFDPDAPAIVLAAQEDNHPEWTGPIESDDDRLALAKAMGAAYYAVVMRSGRHNANVRLISVADPTLNWVVDDRPETDASALQYDAANYAKVGPAAPSTALTAISPPAPVAAPAAPPTPAPGTPSSPASAVAPAPTPGAPGSAVGPSSGSPAANVAATSGAAPVVTVEPPPQNASTANGATSTGVVVTSSPITAVAVSPVTPSDTTAPSASAAPSPTDSAAGVSDESASASGTMPPADNGGVTAVTPSANSGETDAELRDVQTLIQNGDAAVSSGQIAVAISDYEQAIDGAPLSSVPRLKLAQAYLKGGFMDKAIDEAKRGLEIAPDSVPLQEFLIHLDADQSTASGTLAMYQALVVKNPNDVDAHLGLANAYWTNDSFNDAESEFKLAASLSPTGDTRAAEDLAKFYAVQSRYDDAYAEIKLLAPRGYEVAAGIIQTRAEGLITLISHAREDFDAGKSSHEDFYDAAKKVSAEAGALSGFVSEITPPSKYKISHLHRQLSVDLIGQEADSLQSFIETNDPSLEDEASQFETSAQTEILTAHAAEEKLGLYNDAESGK